MAEEEKISSSEEYHRKSNKSILLVALLLVGLAVVGWVMVSGFFDPKVEYPVIPGSGGEGFVRDQGTVQPHEINFGSAAALSPKPSVLNLDAIEVGQTARGVISLTAQGGAIQVLSAEFENRQDGTLELQNGCKQDTVLEEGEGCSITVQWKPASAYKFSNIIKLKWQARRVAGGFDRPKEQVLDITGDARTPCIGACVDEEIKPLPIIAIGTNGTVIGQVHSSGSVVGANSVATARALNDGTVVSFDRRSIMGRAVNMGPVINTSGTVLGQVQDNGQIENAARQVIGRMSVDGVAVDGSGAVIGYPMPRGFVINAMGKPLGEIKNNGQVTDSAGALVGVVLPDGSVMSNGTTVGWLAPQGIVINGPCRAIGYVTPDGQVTDDNKQNLGIVLPSGVAVTRSFRIIGSVVRQGAVVNDIGNYIGYVNQNGQFVDLKGEISGCVNPDASVSLDSGYGIGHVMGSGFAIDDVCSNIGMARSDGQVWAGGTRNIGSVMGNGFVVSKDGALLGRVAARKAWQYNIKFGQDSHYYGAFLPATQGMGNDLNTAIALDHNLAMVNREGRKIGCSTVSGSIFSSDGALAGSLVEMGTVIDAEGAFIGMIDPGGRVINQQGTAIGAINSLGMAVGIAADGRAMVVGYRMPKGGVLNDQGDIIGSITVDGRVADSSGFVVGHVIGDGVVVGRDGAVIGFNVKPGFAVSVRDGTVTLLNSNGELANRQGQRVGYVTHGGSVIGADGGIIAESFPVDSFVAGLDGTWLGKFNSRGELVNAGGGVIGKPKADGRVYNTRGEIIGTLEQPSAFVDSRGNVVAVSRMDGRVTGLLGEPMGRHLSGAVALSDKFEIIGYAVPKGRLFMNPAGQIAGSKQPDGRVINKNQRLIGMANGAGLVLDDGGRVIGSIIEERPVFDSLTAQGQFVGMVRASGQVYGNAELLGRVIAGGIAIGNDGRTIGYTVRRERPRPIYGNFGRYIGLARLDGVGVDIQGQERYRVEADGAAYTVDGDLAGKALDIDHIAVSNDGGLLGAMTYNGATGGVTGTQLRFLGNRLVIDPSGVVGGLMRPYGVVVDALGNIAGFMTVVGKVVDGGGRIIGQAMPSGIAADSGTGPIGEIARTGAALGNDGSVIGQAEPGGTVSGNAGLRVGTGGMIHGGVGLRGQVSPIGSMIGIDGRVVGHALADGNIVGILDRQPLGRLWFNGYAESMRTTALAGVVMPMGAVLSPEGKVVAYADVAGVTDLMGNRVAWVLGDGGVVADGQYIGKTADTGPVIGEAGELLGLAGIDGTVRMKNSGIEHPISIRDDAIAVADNIPIGRVIPTNSAVFRNCGLAGFTDLKAGVVGESMRLVGAIDADWEMFDFDGMAIGSVRAVGPVIAEACKFAGVSTPDGRAVNMSRREIGCQNWETNIVGRQADQIIGTVLPMGAVVALDDETRVIGRVTIDGQALALDMRILGCVSSDGFVVDRNGNQVGKVQRIRVINKRQPTVAGRQQTVAAPTAPAAVRENPRFSQSLRDARQNRRANLSMGNIVPSRRVVAKASGNDGWADMGIPKPLSSNPVDMSLMILQDKVIPAVLVRSLDSRFSQAPVTAIVERNVYTEDGRNIILPSGTRIIGALAGAMDGMDYLTKVEIHWTRIIRPDGVSFLIDGSAGDAQGRPGVPGYVDLQLLKRYGLPMLETLITAAMNYYLMPGSGNVVIDSEGNQYLSGKDMAARDARNAVNARMEEIFRDLIEMAKRNRTVTFIPAGTKLSIFANQDLWLRTDGDTISEEAEKDEQGMSTGSASISGISGEGSKKHGKPNAKPKANRSQQPNVANKWMEQEGQPGGEGETETGGGKGGSKKQSRGKNNQGDAAVEPPPNDDYQIPPNPAPELDGDDGLPPIIF